MKKNLWFMLSFVFLSCVHVYAMDPAPILPEFYACNGREIYTFDRVIFFEKETGKIFSTRMGQEMVSKLGIKPKYGRDKRGGYYTYNGGKTCYNYQGEEITPSAQVLSHHSPQRENSTLNLKKPTEKENPGSFKILAEVNERKERDLRAALRSGANTLIIEVTDLSRNLVWLADLLAFEPLNKVDQIVVRNKNEDDKMPGFIDFMPLSKVLKDIRYSGKLDVRLIKHSCEVAAFYDLIKKTEIDLVLEGSFNSSDMAGMVLAMNDARRYVPKRRNLILRLLKPSDDHDPAVVALNSLASSYKLTSFMDDSLPTFTVIQFGLQRDKRNSARRTSLGRTKSLATITK